MAGLDLELEAPSAGEARVIRKAAASGTPVLVAVDFSSESEAAVTWARTYADAVGAPLEVLHVVHDPADSPGSYRAAENDLLEPMADVAERRLAGFLEQMAREAPDLSGLEEARRICVEGLPVAKILEVAQARSARLLVLGSRRRNGLDRLMHSSTAAQVVRRTELPVTIVKADSR